jgi:hypothetical protein
MVLTLYPVTKFRAILYQYSVTPSKIAAGSTMTCLSGNLIELPCAYAPSTQKDILLIVNTPLKNNSFSKQVWGAGHPKMIFFRKMATRN